MWAKIYSYSVALNLYEEGQASNQILIFEIKRKLCRILNIVVHHQLEIYRISGLWVKDCHHEQNTSLTLFSRVLVFKHFTAGPFGQVTKWSSKAERDERAERAELYLPW